MHTALTHTYIQFEQSHRWVSSHVQYTFETGKFSTSLWMVQISQQLYCMHHNTASPCLLLLHAFLCHNLLICAYLKTWHTVIRPRPFSEQLALPSSVLYQDRADSPDITYTSVIQNFGRNVMLQSHLSYSKGICTHLVQCLEGTG